MASYPRPVTGSRRPPSGMRGAGGGGRPSNAGANPPYRLPTGAGVVPGTGRPGSRAGLAGVGALGSHITVSDRPVTQQGLGGMKTGAKGPIRHVQDKSYYLAQLRGKSQELNVEIIRLTKEIDAYNQESATYLTFEKRAEQLATEIKELQREMADYNTLMDKLNTDAELSSVHAECATLQRQNEMESRSIDAIFAERQELEAEVKQVESEIERERRAAETVVEGMGPDMQQHYRALREESAHIEKDLAEKQEALDKLTAKMQALEEEVSSSEIKLEAFRLHQQLAEAIRRRDEWREKDKETPQEERERLLKQIKADNQESASLGRRTMELQDRLETIRDQMQKASTEMEESKGPHSAKYHELKKREAMITEFIESYDETKAAEQEKISSLEGNIVTILEHISQSMVQSQHLPSVPQFEEMQADLAFKQEEMHKSEATAKALTVENAKLQLDLVKVEELESKIAKELRDLKQSIETMTREIEIFGDLQGLHADEEEKRRLLAEEREKLFEQREAAKTRTLELAAEYEDAKDKLEANDTHVQLGNLEKKWQHHEQNNFVMKEYIAGRQSEGNYHQVAREVASLTKEYNSLLCQSLSGVSAS